MKTKTNKQKKKKSANRSFEENLKQALPNFFCLGLLWLLLVLALVSMSSFSWGKKKKKKIVNINSIFRLKWAVQK